MEGSQATAGSRPDLRGSHMGVVLVELGGGGAGGSRGLRETVEEERQVTGRWFSVEDARRGRGCSGGGTPSRLSVEDPVEGH